MEILTIIRFDYTTKPLRKHATTTCVAQNI